MGRTVEEIKAELKKKQECFDALYLYQSTKEIGRASCRERV